MSTSTTLLDLAAPLWRKHLTSTHPIYKYGMAALCALALATSAQGAAPQVKTQAPGFYRMMLGDFEVTALFDGVLDFNPKELLTHTTHAQVDELLHRSFEGDKVPTSVNAYLINTGDKLVLIDTGAGETLGRRSVLAQRGRDEQGADREAKVLP